MSAPIAGKFQDHYKVLDIDAKSDSETISKAYGRLAQKYHPRNAETGDQTKFDAVNLAYEVLSDAALRAEFDKLKSGGEEKAEFNFSGLDFFTALGRETALRATLLCILYDRRRLKPFTPGLSMRRVEAIPRPHRRTQLALWYLKQRSLVTRDEKRNLLITVEGMDYLETNPPTPEIIMPLVRAVGLAPKAQSAPTAAPAAPPAAIPAPSADTVRGDINVKRIREALSRV
jgi:hypothetical protein